jgi:mRNA interferase MazF
MAGTRPCLVVQNDVGNQYSGVTIVATITGNLKVASLPIGVFLKRGSGGLDKDSVVNCGHVYTVDKSRLGKALGKLEAGVMASVDGALALSLGLARR